MADDLSDKRRRSKKKRSSLLTWKKKFNIKKRFTNKLPLHRRHIRALMSGWSVSDVRSVLTQYEITSMLKQLSLMADKSRLPCSTLRQDLAGIYKTLSCYDVRITCCGMLEEECLLNHNSQDHIQEFKAHRALIMNRWPYMKGILKAQLSSQNRRSFHETVGASGDQGSSENNVSHNANQNTHIIKIHVNGITPEKMSEMLSEVYDGVKSGSSQSHPRKLLPLPTTDDSFHIRNSRGKQTFRYTILECEDSPVTRRNVVRRKHNKNRFSMDERILSKHPVSPVSSHSQQVRTSDVLQAASFNKACNFGADDCSGKPLGEKPIPNSIQDDVLRMYNDSRSGCGDLKIIFSHDSSTVTWMVPHARKRDFSNHYQAWISYYESSNFFPSSSREWQDPLYCHQVILAARSPFFRKLIDKQMTSPTWWDSGNSGICTIEIDGGVIPPRYMSAVLHTMYTDKVDLLRLYERIGQGGMPMSGVPVHFHLRDAMMLHHIGRFIEFPQLVSGCEEFIVSSVDQNNLLQVLQWASLPDGSDWVKRQVNNFIREQFMELSNVLYELNVSQIVEVLKSDFVNASELDILKCALRWGEHELLRRIEDREPNLLTHTTHSVSRSKTASARRRELMASRIEELHDCTAPVLACVRMQHVLPPNHELFTNAVKRGVISRPPTDLLESVNDRESSSRQWIKSRVDFVPPRLFQPYMDETRNILDERFAQESDCVSLRSMHSLSRDQTWCSVRQQMELASHGIPDALYMVGQARLPTRRRYGNRDLHLSFTPSRLETSGQNLPPAKYIGDFYPVPEISVLREMMARERELRSTYIVNKVLRACIDCCHNNGNSFGPAGSNRRKNTSIDDTNSTTEDLDETEHCNRCTALRLVRLFVVRERGLPDCAIDLLQRPELYFTFSQLRGMAVADASRNLAMMQPDRSSKILTRAEPNISREQFHIHDRNSTLQSQHPPAYKEPPVLRKKQDASNHPDVRFDFSSPSNSNIPPKLRQDVLIESSSSSSDEGEVVHVRRRRKSLSRKGSSSTTSYQSIPDVAASANSSLQRLRKSSHKIVQDLCDSPLTATTSNFLPPSKSTDDYQYFAKLTETETCDSSSSSCEENTSENDVETRQNLFHQNSTFSETESSKQNDVLRSQKFRPPRRPVSTDISELFKSTFNFIDDPIESSDDNLSELLSPQSNNVRDGSHQLDMPELLKDGTLPRPDVQTAPEISAPRYVKPDIYPLGGENMCTLGDQCGQYFFCSLTREKMTKSKSGTATKKSGTSFSFAINNGKPGHSQKKSGGKEHSDSVDDDTIFL